MVERDWNKIDLSGWRWGIELMGGWPGNWVAELLGCKARESLVICSKWTAFLVDYQFGVLLGRFGRLMGCAFDTSCNIDITYA